MSSTSAPRATTLSLMPILLIGYMWLYIHRPFEVWPWLADLRIERLYMLVTLGCWFVVSDKGWTGNRLNAAFGLLFAAICVTWLASPYQEEGWRVVENSFKVGVFYVLLISCVRDEKTLRFVVVGFLVSTALYMLHSLWEYQNGRHDFQMGTARMIGVDSTKNNPNAFGSTLIYSLAITLAFWHDARGRLSRMALAIYTVLSTTCVFLTGSRSAFGGFLCLASMTVMLSRHRVAMLIAAIVLAPVAWGLLPEDRQNRYMTLVDPDYGGGHGKTSAESRWVFLVQAYDLWTKSPVVGFGPGSFPLASETGMEVHSVYGQLLSEVGLIGMFAFTLVLYGFGANHRQMMSLWRGVPWVSRGFTWWLSVAVVISVVLHLVSGTSNHNLYRYTWMWFGALQAAALGIRAHQVVDDSLPLELFEEPVYVGA